MFCTSTVPSEHTPDMLILFIPCDALLIFFFYETNSLRIQVHICGVKSLCVSVDDFHPQRTTPVFKT